MGKNPSEKGVPSVQICPVTQTAAVFVPLIILKRKTRKQQQPNTGQLQQCALHGLFFLPRPLSVLSLLYFRLQIALLAGKSQPRCSCEIIPGISALPGQVECFFFSSCTVELCLWAVPAHPFCLRFCSSLSVRTPLLPNSASYFRRVFSSDSRCITTKILSPFLGCCDLTHLQTRGNGTHLLRPQGWNRNWELNLAAVLTARLHIPEVKHSRTSISSGYDLSGQFSALPSLSVSSSLYNTPERSR